MAKRRKVGKRKATEGTWSGGKDFPNGGKCWPRMRNAGGKLLKFNPSRVASTLPAQCRWK